MSGTNCPGTQDNQCPAIPVSSGTGHFSYRGCPAVPLGRRTRDREASGASVLPKQRPSKPASSVFCMKRSGLREKFRRQ
jgi:hypothetical protein